MIEREIALFLLRYLVRKPGAVSRTELKNAIRTAFTARFSDGDLNGYLEHTETVGWTSATTDELFGLMYALTPTGKIKANQLL